ncbi:hypothetical protein ILUMI_05382 [Ignelater luminosus]|uniref:Rho-GAP domain-containing protein n=1 Tax=Ignelater luminosus TaxID=2038154 RepID=A0A8K0DCQ6_IGNLU|nr:hypothetical protein ILUMI_05382 [Ignelater luminosus]
MFGTKVKRTKSFINTRTPKNEELPLPESSHLSRRITISPSSMNNVKLKHTQSDKQPSKPVDLSVQLSQSFQFRKIVQKNNLEKRKSLSMNDVVLQRGFIDRFVCINKNEPKSPDEIIAGQGMSSHNRSASDFEIRKHCEKTFEYDQVLKELKTKHRRTSQEYASLEKLKEEKGQTLFNQTRPFPIENTTVEIRHAPNETVIRRNNYRSQTVHEYALGNLEQQLENIEIQIDLKGVTKICFDSATRKPGKNQFLRISGDQLLLINDKGDEEILINCLNQTKYKPISKKEIAITKIMDDMSNLYKLQFDSAKDMNLAIMDLERYYGSNRPVMHKLYTHAEETSQIKYRLLKLLGKRSSKDFLEKRGIIRNEPIFGNTLKHLYEMYKQDVPEFVIRIMQFIELPKNIASVGLYRASGNLATIQKIRFHIDKNNLKILDEFKNDSDVLTGSLKLFFRELKEPLIPHKTYEELCRYIETEINSKIEENIKHIISKMEKPHKRTLLTLLEHLLKVESHSEENKMDTYNISIVWGPTLIWPPDNCHENILLSHTNANKVIELLLNVYKRSNEVPYKQESSPKLSVSKENEEESKAARENLQHNKNALMLELSENLNYSLRKAGSKDNLMKSTDSLTKLRDDYPRTPDKETKYNLEQLCKSSKEKIPEFVLKVIPLIEKGIDTELLYKRTGSNEKLEKIRKKIVKPKSNLNSMEKYNVHDLAWALRNFFSELNEPLIPKDVFTQLVLATDEGIETTKLRNTKRELNNAHIPHRETLDYLLKHLVNVSWHEELNKMSKHNVATEWAPFLCRSFIENHEISAGSCIHVLETLLYIYDNKTIINIDSEKHFKHHMEIYNNIMHRNSKYHLAKSPDKWEEHNDTKYLGRSPDRFEKFHIPSVALKRRPRIVKNDSSLYRASRYVPNNTLSLYDNVHSYAENVKDEATILETTAVKNGAARNVENRTKL